MAEGSGTKSSLLWEVKRLLTECDELPRILLLENVPQILNEKNNGDFYRWIEFLESKGYQNKWCVMNAKEYGVPQNRERCFMVSWLGDYYYDFPKPRKLEKFMRDLYEPKVDKRYYLSEKGVKSVVQRIGKYTNIMDSETDIARHTITAVGNANWTGNFVADAVCVGGIGTPKSNGGTQWYQQDRIYEGDIALAHPATLTPQGNYYYLIEEPICYDEQNNRLRTDGTCGALTTDGSSPKHNNRIITAKKIRRLTPRECFRLMDFDDCDFDKVRPIMSDAQLYKQAGNSVVMNCLVEIFKEMI